MESYRLDRQAFSVQSFEEASKQRDYWMQKTAMERLAAAWYLVCTAYQLDYHGQHRLDRTAFSIRTRSNG
jgi:hypothetical protein